MNRLKKVKKLCHGKGEASLDADDRPGIVHSFTRP